jgi:hypothetical protein
MAKEMTEYQGIARKSLHRGIYIASLCLIAIFLPSSRWLLTVSELILAVNWLAEGDFRTKFSRLRADRAAIAFILIYLLNVTGLAWSADPGYGLSHDLLHKLPTLFMPLIVATTALPGRKMTRVILWLFISSVLFVTFFGFLRTQMQPAVSFREASPFIPGIYLGLMVVIAAFQLLMMAWEIRARRFFFVASLVAAAWLIFFLFYLRALSGVAAFIAAMIWLIMTLASRSEKHLVKIAVPAGFAVLAGVVLWPMAGICRDTHAENPVALRSLEPYTASGNPYLHDTLNIIRENGNLVYLYIADGELREAWNERSSLDYDGTNLAGQELRATIFRYMSSLGLRKDREHFMMLSGNDIAAIEEGVTNHLNIDRPGFYVRAYEEMMSLYLYRKSSGRMTDWGSLTKRIDLWKASWEAFMVRPLLGWGTGGILKAVEHGLQKNNSELSGLNMKPHSQYLFILNTLGAAGLIITIMLYAFFVVEKKAYKSLMFILFLVVFLVNFTGNNSLESQPGQDLFVFLTMIYGYFSPPADLR